MERKAGERDSQFSFFAVVMFYEVTINTQIGEYKTIAPRGSIELVSCETQSALFCQLINI